MRTVHAAAARRARSTSPCGGRRRCRWWPAPAAAGGVMRRYPRPLPPCAPSLRSSVAIAAMRSVSFTRQLRDIAQRARAVGEQRGTASVIAASGMWLQSASIACSGARSRAAPRSSSRRVDAWRPCAASASTKRTSPWMLSRPTPSTRTGRRRAIAPAARKYEADDASPSTWIVPGTAVALPAGTVNALPAVALAPRRRSARIRLSVISTYGLEISSPTTSIATRAARRAAAAPSAARSGTGSTRRRARASARAGADLRRDGCAAAESRRRPW